MTKYYCCTCGSELMDSGYCYKCEVHRIADDMDRSLKRRNDDKHPTEKWQKVCHHWGHNGMVNPRFCDNCKYFMWHSLNWCSKCGGKYREERISTTDLLTKYSDYKVGW